MDRVKDVFVFVALVLCALVVACNNPRPDPPNGWIRKVNNNVIGRVSIDNQIRNCASTSGKHVICDPLMDTLETACTAFVTFTDGSPRERWQKDCQWTVGDTLIFDDGRFSYFYGTRSNP